MRRWCGLVVALAGLVAPVVVVGCATGAGGGVPVAPSGTTVVDRSPPAGPGAGAGGAGVAGGDPLGGDGDAGVVRAAASRTAALGQLGYVLTVSQPGAGSAVPVLAVTGAVDRGVGRHSLVVRQWVAGGGAPPETSDVVVDGDAVYLRSPVVSRLAAPGAPARTWLRVVGGPAMVPGASSVDGPAAVTGVLELVATAQSAAPGVGDTVAGVAVRRHRVVLAGAGTAPGRVGVWQVVDGAAVVWVDDAGLLRAAEVVVAGDGGVRLVVRFEVTATAVTPAPVPTGDDVVDVAPAAVSGVVR